MSAGRVFFHPTVDQLNFALILLCALLAYILPFELVLLSYAFLGPAHYLTQINWMHQRRYFAPKWPFLYPAIAAVGVALVVPAYTGPALFMAMVLAVVSLLPVAKWVGIAVVAVAGGLYFPLASQSSLLELAFAVLLPTVIHVFVFTWVFMVTGALRSRSVWGGINVMLMPLCMVAFFAIPPSGTPVFKQFVEENSSIFAHILPRIGEVFGFTPQPSTLVSFMAFLSFAYTYHYLNWFSKAEVIKWHQTTRHAWGLILMCYAASLALYVYDYRTGFVLLLFLSLLHVVLEFPLNVQSIKGLPQLALTAWRR